MHRLLAHWLFALHASPMPRPAQTPLRHRPLAHWLFVLHASPMPRPAQTPLRHRPLSQWISILHTSPIPPIFLHRPSKHRPVSHCRGSVQASPAPSKQRLEQASADTELPSSHSSFVSALLFPQIGCWTCTVVSTQRRQQRLSAVPFRVPSSHCSPVSRTPSPHVDAGAAKRQYMVQFSCPSHSSPESIVLSPQRGSLQSVLQRSGNASEVCLPMPHCSPLSFTAFPQTERFWQRPSRQMPLSH